MYVAKFSGSLMSLCLLGLFALGSTMSFAQTGINDKVSRNNGASFFANGRISRNIQHARSYSQGIQRYTTQAQVIQPQVTKAESEMLGLQLQGIKRDLTIVREENASKPKVVEQVKKLETELEQASSVQKNLHAECCKDSPDGKACAEMCDKLHASLDNFKKEHDKLLKELGHEEAAHDTHNHADSKAAK